MAYNCNIANWITKRHKEWQDLKRRRHRGSLTLEWKGIFLENLRILFDVAHTSTKSWRPHLPQSSKRGQRKDFDFSRKEEAKAVRWTNEKVPKVKAEEALRMSAVAELDSSSSSNAENRSDEVVPSTSTTFLPREWSSAPSKWSRQC